MKPFWRKALLAVALSGSLILLCLYSTFSHPPDAQASVLKTTEEPLDPACNALGKLQVNVSAAVREQTSDENGGMINSCRYQVELVNTDEQNSIMVFTNASGTTERGNEVWHSLHGHKALDPGESYQREMYVTVYPDGSEESNFYTYLKATFNDIDFPKDCRPLIDHLYTWDLPYRLLETPCLNLSTDPPELVEWTPPEGYPAPESQGDSAEPASSGESETGEAGETSSESGEPQAEGQQPAQQGEDLMSQLVELLLMGDLGSLDQWEGWAGLTDTQRHNLLAIIERLDERASEYLPPSQLELLNETERQEALAQQRQELLEQHLQERVQAWERLDMLINRERARDQGDWALWIYDNYRASQLLTGAYNEVRGWFDRLANKEDWAKDEAIKYLQENTGISVEEAAQAILAETASLANSPARAHYSYYLDFYNQYREQGLSHEQAHPLAMQELREASEDPPASGGGILNDDIWQSQNFSDLSAPGGIYDRVFGELKGNYDPGVYP